MTPPAKKTSQTRSKKQRLLLEQLVKGMLNRGKHVSEIKKAAVLKYCLSPRSVERYISRARQDMVEQSQTPDEEVHFVAYDFYRSIISDTNSTQHERLNARKRIDKLLGLEVSARSHQKAFDSDVTPQQIQNVADLEREQSNRQSHIESSDDSI